MELLHAVKNKQNKQDAAIGTQRPHAQRTHAPSPLRDAEKIGPTQTPTVMTNVCHGMTAQRWARDTQIAMLVLHQIVNLPPQLDNNSQHCLVLMAELR